MVRSSSKSPVRLPVSCSRCPEASRGPEKIIKIERSREKTQLSVESGRSLMRVEKSGHVTGQSPQVPIQNGLEYRQSRQYLLDCKFALGVHVLVGQVRPNIAAALVMDRVVVHKSPAIVGLGSGLPSWIEIPRCRSRVPPYTPSGLEPRRMG